MFAASIRGARLHCRALAFPFVTTLAMLLAAWSSGARAQAPAVQWQRSDWFPTHPSSGPQVRTASGEDWWYDHKNSYSGSVLNGYICAGYSTFVNWPTSESGSSGCLDAGIGAPDCDELESPGNVKGNIVAAMALITPNGAGRVWYKTYNYGWFYRVIQTSDGGYLGIGPTASTRTPGGAPLYYNPNQFSGATTDAFSNPVACTLGDNMPHINLVKTDANGNVQWQYLYGMKPYRDINNNPQPAVAYATFAEGWDVLETPAGNFRLVGRAQDPPLTYFCNNQNNALSRACMIEVAANGHWLWGKLYGPTTVPSNGTAITRYGSGVNLRYVMSGTELFQGSAFNGYTGCNLYQKVWVMQFDATPSPAPLWTTTNFDFTSSTSQFRSQSNYDVQISVRNSVNEILVPVIVNCTNCLYSGYNSGDAKVYRLNGAGQVLGLCSLGTVTAYDLKLRVSPTADGGFGAISSKQVVPPPAPYSCYGTSYWNTDAYVGRCNACGNLEWETTFNVDNILPAPYPADLKKQECMYSISQGADGGFVVAGNNSYNFDDCYLAKLDPATPITTDLYLQDTPQDVGLEANPDNGPMWVTDDIWIRNQQDNGLIHQNPEYSPTVPVYVYVRVRNKGCSPASGELKVYWAKASTGLSWPAQWVNYVVGSTVYGDQIPSSPLLINNLLPNASVTFSIPWFVPNPNDFISFGADKAHFCMVARVETAPTSPFGMTFPEGTSIYTNVRNNNNIVWKNLTVVDNFQFAQKDEYVIVRNTAAAGATLKLEFVARHVGVDSAATFLNYGSIQVDLGSALFHEWAAAGMAGGGVAVADTTTIQLLQPNAEIHGLALSPGEMHTIRMHFTLLQPAPPYGTTAYNFDLLQYSTTAGLDQLDGGQRFAIHPAAPTAVEPAEPAAVGGPRLEQNVPNPFTGPTSIAFALDRKSHVRLRILDVAGRLVTTLVDADFGAGKHRLDWNGLDRAGHAVARGVYYYELQADGVKRSRKFVRVE